MDELPSSDVYIGIFGDWDVMPRKWEVVDNRGSIKVDLDGDGSDDYVWVRDAVKDTDIGRFTVFEIEYKGVFYELDTLFHIADPTADGFFIWPLDANGDGLLEVFIIDMQMIEWPECLEMYSLDSEITKFKFGYYSSP